MTLLGSVDHKIAGRRAQTAILDASGNTVARAFQGNEVRFRATARECAETLWAIVE